MDSVSAHSDWLPPAPPQRRRALGVLTFALFPFALPVLVLTIAATLPLVLPLVVVAGVAAILRGTWLGIRAAGRGIRRLQPLSDAPEPRL